MKLGESKEDYLEAMYILKRQKDMSVIFCFVII